MLRMMYMCCNCSVRAPDVLQLLSVGGYTAPDALQLLSAGGALRLQADVLQLLSAGGCTAPGVLRVH